MQFVGLVPLAIGVLVVLNALTGFGMDTFHQPPLFFRLFQGIIGTGFILFGVGWYRTASRISGAIPKNLADVLQQRMSQPSSPEQPATPGTYTCPQCGATLAENVDVSPLGDVKCTFCSRWFNIHQS